MDSFSLKRVIWRDGDVITESHFLEQEKWIESQFGLSNLSDLKYSSRDKGLTNQYVLSLDKKYQSNYN